MVAILIMCHEILATGTVSMKELKFIKLFMPLSNNSLSITYEASDWPLLLPLVNSTAA